MSDYLISKVGIMKISTVLGIAAIVLVPLAGCSDDGGSDPYVDTGEILRPANTDDAEITKGPFEYKIVSEEEMIHTWGPQVVVNLETTNEIAKEATKEELEALWEELASEFGDRRVFIYLRTPVPGATPWGVISRIKRDGEWSVGFKIQDIGIDAEPFHFVNTIDRSVANQRAMIVTLPMVNAINEQLTNRGWKIKSRTEDFYSAESRSGGGSIQVTLTPESVDIQMFAAAGNSFTDSIDVVFSELGIAETLKKKLFTVIGSPEYLRVAPGEPARWNWRFDELVVTYTRLPEIDYISAIYEN